MGSRLGGLREFNRIDRGVLADVATLGRQEPTDEEIDALDSDDWYNLGLALEEVDPDRAPEAYQRAIALDPKNTDAYVNLAAAPAARAAEAGEEALPDGARVDARAPARALQPRHALRRALEEYDTAMLYYRQALVVPDAHFNLARIYELKGDELAALRHLRRYRQLVDAP